MKTSIQNRTSDITASVREVCINVFRAVQLVWTASAGYCLVSAVLTTMLGVLPAAEVWVVKAVIDKTAQAIVIARDGGTPHIASIGWLVIFLFLLVVVSRGAEVVNETARVILGERLRYHINLRILEKANALDLLFFETPQFYDKLAKASSEAGHRPMDVVTNLAWGVQSSLTLLSMSLLLFRLHWFALVGLILITLPHVVARFYFGKYSWGLINTRVQQLRWVYYLQNILTSREHAKEVRIFRLRDYVLNKWQDIWIKFFAENKRLYVRRGLTTVFLSLISAATAAGVKAYVVLRTIFGRATLGDLTLYFQAVDQFQASLGTMLTALAQLYENNLFLSNLFGFLDLQPAMTSGPLALAGSRDGQEDPGERAVPFPVPIQQGIEFRNVSFSYPKTDRVVLRAITFSIRPGERVAIVGENGAGKTTLVKLLARLYDPTEGEIWIDGRNLQEYDLEELRRQYGVIFQDYVKYQFTLRENIGLGQVEQCQDLSRIIRAAEKGGGDAVAAKLPKGYETGLGRLFDEGVELSGGEWQKVALSRAFMAETAQVLILDEPTASLDAPSEYEIYRSFAELTDGKTTVFISHRFSTVRMADRIIVLHDGTIIEQGSHEELMSRGGKYAEMFNMQAEPYR